MLNQLELSNANDIFQDPNDNPFEPIDIYEFEVFKEFLNQPRETIDNMSKKLIGICEAISKEL